MSVETFLSIVPSSLYRSIVKSDPKSFVFTLSIILMVFPLNWTCEKTKQKRFALNVKRNFLQNWGLFFQCCKRASEKLFLTQKTTWLEFHFLSSVCSGTLVSLAVPSAPVFLLLRFVELKLRLTPSKLFKLFYSATWTLHDCSPSIITLRGGIFAILAQGKLHTNKVSFTSFKKTRFKYSHVRRTGHKSQCPKFILSRSSKFFQDLRFVIFRCI